MRNPELSTDTFETVHFNEYDRLLQELEQENQSLRQIIQKLEENPPLWKVVHSAVAGFLRRHTKWFLAFPNLTATLLWLAMLIYFSVWYLTLPKDDKGRHPQICDNFSLWPYISCIGEKRLPVFRAVCITMAVFISTSFSLLCYLGNPIAPGRWLRRVSAFFALMSSGALVSLSFESVDASPTAHLISTTIQIFAMGNTKFFDWVSNSIIRRSFRKQMGPNCRVRPLEVSRWLKTCAAAFAAVPAMITCMGIYNCMDTDVNNDSTSSCNKVIALSAVSEWLLSIGWVAYLSTISYDLYHIDIVVKLWQDAMESPAVEVENLHSNVESKQISHQSLQHLLPHGNQVSPRYDYHPVPYSDSSRSPSR